MATGIYRTPPPRNEPVREYAPDSLERTHLKNRLEELYRTELEVLPIIGGRRVRTSRTAALTCPHEHAHRLGLAHLAGRTELEWAVAAALGAGHEWARMPFEHRAAVFLKAAELLAGPLRDTLNAASMLALSKSAHQAEIDAACELVDYLRFNVHFARQLMELQPESAPGVWNRVELRPLGGFVLAVTPFNFTSIAANLPTAPALMGNTVVWKPAASAVYPAHFIMELLHQAGLPEGVINLVPAPAAELGEVVLPHPELAGLHFTGSTEVFNHLWQAIAGQLGRYRRYPRLVGETGGKDFVFVHPSAHLDEAVTALTRGAFEYQGQKCSAASRAYLPESLWPELREAMLAQLARVRLGDPRDFSNFMNAVIDRRAFERIRAAIAEARATPGTELVAGGGSRDEPGYFIEPTVLRVDDPRARVMREEIFGPVLSVFVYPDREFEATLELCDQTSPYALTGSFFATDRRAIALACDRLAEAAGNFYVNDKPTGAVVGQQPFGGGRASGTNDKSGSPLNLQRWVSVRTIKENFLPPTDFSYGFNKQA
ncbi:MAG TPA: L-glutamate gamma-semialdehyde dehydrogenase [Myxococcota bacterium]|nr:L-glutamate gamma-semialdehyde dehydrogenase [Myxococcota bacterium]HRY93355.1 L-glutamate gamma-semialdehyde dehydrogenase [Myxococcota bacterium]HSA20150.1 L-glutamate gamma-semialdehyde dehydrogenase [Myxococcota bacterium]